MGDPSIRDDDDFLPTTSVCISATNPQSDVPRLFARSRRFAMALSSVGGPVASSVAHPTDRPGLSVAQDGAGERHGSYGMGGCST